MSLVEFEPSYITGQSNQSLLMLRKMKPAGRELDGFRGDPCARLECLLKLSPSHCAVDPRGRETTQSLSSPADLLLPIAPFYSLFFGSV